MRDPSTALTAVTVVGKALSLGVAAECFRYSSRVTEEGVEIQMKIRVSLNLHSYRNYYEGAPY